VKPGKLQDLSNLSMLDLFRVEAENQAALLTSGLLELERGATAPDQLETLMRAAHSLKGAARIVNLQIAVTIAHAMEDCFVAAQTGKLLLGQKQIDALFRGVDLLLHISKRNEVDISQWEAEHGAEIQQVLEGLKHLMKEEKSVAGSPDRPAKPRLSTLPALPDSQKPSSSGSAAEASMAEGTTAALAPRAKPESPERVLRLTAENLNRLLSLAGESLVESRWLRPFADSLQRLKRQQAELSEKLADLRETFEGQKLSDRAERQLAELVSELTQCRQSLAERIEELDSYDRRSAHLSHRLYLEVLRTRMRPFADGLG